MAQKATTVCVPLGGSMEKEFAIRFENSPFRWVDVRRTTELVADFIIHLESDARRIGIITQNESILTLKMVKDDGNDLGDIDFYGTLGDILQYMGDTYLVAVIDTSNAPPTREAARVELSNNTNDEGGDQPRNITAPPKVPSADGGASSDGASSDVNNDVVLLTNKWGVPIRVTVANLSCFFNVFRAELAQQLGISSNLFKRTITELGLKRWPSRTIWILENAIQGLEFAIATGGFGQEVADLGFGQEMADLQSSLNSLKTKKDELQHGSIEVINRMVAQKSELVPLQVREFLRHGVLWSFEESRALPSDRNSVMEVFAVERPIPDPLGGGGVHAVGTHEAAGEEIAPLVAKSGRGRKRRAGVLANHKPVSGKRAKRAKRVVAMQHKGDSGFSDSDDS